MDNSIDNVLIEQVITETVQTNVEKKSFVSLVSNIISVFQNWWWLLGLCFIFLIIIIYLLSNKRNINKLSRNKLQEFKQNRKYIPHLFIDFSNTKELLRYFIYGEKWKIHLIEEFNHLYSKSKIIKLYNKLYKKNKRLHSYKLFVFTSLKKIGKIIKSHISYFDTTENFRKKLKSFPDYNILNEVSTYYYTKTLNELLQKYELINKKYVIIKSSAGNGKTNLACNIVDLLLNLNKRVIFINAKDIDIDFQEYLIKRLNIFPLLKLCGLERWIYYIFPFLFKIFIVIDAINENDNSAFPKQLFNEIDNLQNKKVKFILTCREEYFEQRYKCYIDTATHKPYIISLDKSWSYSDREKKLYIEKYCEEFNTGEPNTFIADQLFSTSLLLFRLYFEVNSGKKNQNLSLYKYRIYEEYIKMISNKYPDIDVYSIINNISEKMIETHNYNNISITSLTNDSTTINNIKQISDDNLLTGRKIELYPNTIAKTEQEVIYFPFDEMRDYCLAKYLAYHYYDKKQKNIEQSRKYLFDYLSSLKLRSPLEGILHYLYLQFKDDKEYDICKDLLLSYLAKTSIINNNWLYESNMLFNDYAILVIFDSEHSLENFEIDYITKILPQDSYDTNKLLIYLYDQEFNGMNKKLSLLLNILYSYSDFNILQNSMLIYYNSDFSHLPYTKNNKCMKRFLSMFLKVLETNKCLGFLEILTIIILTTNHLNDLDKLLLKYSRYTKILNNIITNSKCLVLQNRAKNILTSILFQITDKELEQYITTELKYYE